MLIIAPLIKLTSPGPVFFRQKRYGLDGREILVWKFRSMKCCDNGASVKQATAGDDRITPLGRVLRRTSLDELPQLFNVLEGTMSLVGPRPHANAHNEAVSHPDRRLHAAPQGEAGHHRPGAGERLPRRDRNARKDGPTRRLRPPLHPRVVLRPGPEDPAQDAAGGVRAARMRIDAVAIDPT